MRKTHQLILVVGVVAAMKGCEYQDPGLPPHPVEPTQHTIDPTSTDYPSIPPVEKVGPAPSTQEGQPCTRAGQERNDPNTGASLVCRSGTWVRR